MTTDYPDLVDYLLAAPAHPHALESLVPDWRRLPAEAIREELEALGLCDDTIDGYLATVAWSRED